MRFWNIGAEGQALMSVWGAIAVAFYLGTSVPAWLLLVLNIPASSINSVDPQLRAGGDVRYVMLVTLSAVWLIRLPLTYLFCFVWQWGVPGIFLANSISLYYRTIMGLLRRRGDKWLSKKV